MGEKNKLSSSLAFAVTPHICNFVSFINIVFFINQTNIVLTDVFITTDICVKFKQEVKERVMQLCHKNLKEKLHPGPKISMSCALSQNYGHLFEKITCIL